eukprot:355440-Chlamydomonas_euryale.AAC.1
MRAERRQDAKIRPRCVHDSKTGRETGRRSPEPLLTTQTRCNLYLSPTHCRVAAGARRDAATSEWTS